MSARALIVDDDRTMCEFLETALGREGYRVRTAESARTAFEILADQDFDVVVTDLNMPETGGIELCARMAAQRPEVPVIVITAFGSLDTAIAAIRAGAYDFITKPFETDVLVVAVKRAVEHRMLRAEVERLRDAVATTRTFEDLVGSSPAMNRVYELMARLADSDASVLITGESGTGKELAAKALHRRGRRTEGPFVAVDCSALPETLIESELFGHSRGAFTDASNARDGLLLRADGGTLFLDEIGNIPLPVQAKLLRALEERRFRPVGSDREVPFDVRLISATNRDLDTAIEEGRFRDDLYFRINVVHIELPPLRARSGDVLVLAQHFLESFAARELKAVTGFTPAAARCLSAYAWPGNVRELRNCIERAIALCRHHEVGVEDLPDRVRSYRPSQVVLSTDDPSEMAPLEEVERRYIARVLEAVGGNKTLAARVLGLDRKTLYRKLEKTAADKPGR
jgi:two-component system response regulator AtoC